MAEIKSTIDLIMERTRGMSLTPEEKDDFRREELRKRARGLKLKILTDPSNVEMILSSLNGESAEDRKLLENFLWELMVEDLPKNEQIFKYLDLLEKLPGAQAKAETLARLRTSFKAMLKSHVEERKKIIAREKKKLAAFGISGTAVIPKIPKENAANIEFTSVLDQFKKELVQN